MLQESVSGFLCWPNDKDTGKDGQCLTHEPRAWLLLKINHYLITLCQTAPQLSCGTHPASLPYCNTHNIDNFNWQNDKSLTQFNLLYHWTFLCCFLLKQFDFSGCRWKVWEVLEDFFNAKNKKKPHCYKINAQCKELTFPLRDPHRDKKLLR